MSVPFNEQDYKRLLKLAELIRNKSNNAEINVYISEGYVSLEMRGRDIPVKDIKAIVEEGGECGA